MKNLVLQQDITLSQGQRHKMQKDIKETLKCTTSIDNVLKTCSRQNIIFIARLLKVQELIK